MANPRHVPFTNVSPNFLGRIVAWDELSLGTNCRLGRIFAWDELSLGTNCRLGRIVAWDELSLGTNCRLGRIVAWDELSLGMNCRFGRTVALRRFRTSPKQSDNFSIFFVQIFDLQMKTVYTCNAPSNDTCW